MAWLFTNRFDIVVFFLHNRSQKYQYLWSGALTASDQQTDSRPITPALIPQSRRSFATVRAVLALMLREMSTRYGRSPGGYIWAVVEPIGAIVVLAIGFSLLLHSPSLGNSFLLFYATGYLSFSLYMDVSGMVARSLGFSKPLLAYPSVTWVDAVLARWLLNTLTGLTVAYILLAGILSTIDTRVSLDILPIMMALSLASLLGMGVGLLNCALIGMFPAWGQIWSIITRPLFLGSGVIYIYEDLPRSIQDIIWYNPLIHITGLMRTGFYPMYAPNYISILYVLTCGLVTVVLGLILLRRYHNDIINA